MQNSNPSEGPKPNVVSTADLKEWRRLVGKAREQAKNLGLSEEFETAFREARRTTTNQAEAARQALKQIALPKMLKETNG